MGLDHCCIYALILCLSSIFIFPTRYTVAINIFDSFPCIVVYVHLPLFLLLPVSSILVFHGAPITCDTPPGLYVPSHSMSDVHVDMHPPPHIWFIVLLHYFVLHLFQSTFVSLNPAISICLSFITLMAVCQYMLNSLAFMPLIF